MSEESPPFYLVWAEDGGEPRHKHERLEHAESEAERLAKANPGQSFCVVVPISRFTERRVTIERFNPLIDEIPF